jgi:hypothetical protein
MGIAAFIVTAPFAKPCASKCPLWVISGHYITSASCLLCPRKRTSLRAITVSAWFHNRTNDAEAKNWVKGTRYYRRASRIRTSPITAVPPP